MNLNELKNYLIEEERKSFSGWDFSYINERIVEEPLPWNYQKIVKEYLKPSHKLLDIGTGGGEFLLSLRHPYQNTSATEAYQPNFILCKETLSPLGIDVRKVFDDNFIPFEDNYFDIIIDRHESFSISEVNRMLKPEGIFITQQVGGQNNKTLSTFLLGDFNEIIDPQYSLDKNIDLFRDNGFSILRAEEYFPKLKFLDIGAFVYFAKVIEWEFPGFSVEKYFDKLCELQTIIENQGYIESLEHRFFLLAKKL